MAKPRVGIVAVQGAFAQHADVFVRLGAEVIELRQAGDLDLPFDKLVLPGGESTAQGRIMRDLGMLDPLRDKIADGMPVLGTCAGLILLANRIDSCNGDGSVVDEQHNSTWFGTLDVTVRRNAYGRQLGSFKATADFAGLGQIPMTFIRAPFVTSVGFKARELVRVNGNVVAVQQDNQIGLSFHPELDESLAIHELFLGM